jgi:hypothetical protein
MRIEDLKRQYLAAYPEGLWFANGGRGQGKFFPTRTVYGGKYFIEGTTEDFDVYDNGALYERRFVFKVWRVVLDKRMQFELLDEFGSLDDARGYARLYVKGEK